MLMTFILVDTSVITVLCVVAVGVVAVVAVVSFAAMVGISIVMSSAMTAKLDR